MQHGAFELPAPAGGGADQLKHSLYRKMENAAAEAPECLAVTERVQDWRAAGVWAAGPTDDFLPHSCTWFMEPCSRDPAMPASFRRFIAKRILSLSTHCLKPAFPIQTQLLASAPKLRQVSADWFKNENGSYVGGCCPLRAQATEYADYLSHTSICGRSGWTVVDLMLRVSCRLTSI
jgi:hypothetical protein